MTCAFRLSPGPSHLGRTWEREYAEALVRIGPAGRPSWNMNSHGIAVAMTIPAPREYSTVVGRWVNEVSVITRVLGGRLERNPWLA